MNHKSQSIPITRNSISAREDAEQQREAMIADFKDYLFFNRLVDGMKQRQSKSRCIDLRYQNQALINHLTATRNTTILSSPPNNCDTDNDYLNLVMMPSPPLTSCRRTGHSAGLSSLGEPSREQVIVSCVSDTLALIHGRDGDGDGDEASDDEDLMFDMEV